METESIDSMSSTSLTEAIDGAPNLEERELKLLMVPCSDLKAPLVCALGAAVALKALPLRLSRVHLMATPTRITTFRADRQMAAMVPAELTPTEPATLDTSAWAPWSENKQEIWLNISS